MLERIVASQLNQHLKINNLVNPLQSAYKTAHSTESALLKVKSDIHISIAKGECIALTLLDLSAAFDTINHEILLHRLSLCFGFSGVALRWFTSYLSLRTQSVKVNDTLSKAVPLIYGVPQGSVLGPILFTLYTTPLSEVIQSFKGVSHHLYADDTQIYTSLTPRNANSNLTALQKCVAAAQSWMTENRLKLNPDKTEFLLIGTPAKRDAFEQYFPLDILGSPVSPCKSARNLGVLFDSGFTFSNHISAISRACYANIRILSRVRRYLSFKASKMLASALVSSRLDYCNSLLASCTGKDLRRLQILQNILCRVVCRLPWRARVSSSMKSLHWLPIRFRINFKISVIVYKTLQSGEPKYLKEFLHPYASSKNTRRSNPDKKFLITFNFDRKLHSSTHQLSHSFAYSAPRLWNDLPFDLRSAETLASFRKNLKTHLFSVAYPPG